MPTPAKPPTTGESHPLPFDQLAPGVFERLCFWLVKREGFDRAEHFGEAGRDHGRDIAAWKGDRHFVFQCKRVQAFGPATASKEIAKLRALPDADQPQELVFVVSRAVSADARKAIRQEWGSEATCHFWAGNELDERVQRHHEIVEQFFQLPPDRSSILPAIPVLGFPYSSLGGLFHGREEVLILLRECLTSSPAGRATAITGKAVHGLGGVGKTRLAIEYAWRYAKEHSALLFVGAGSPADLRRNLAGLAAGLDLPEKEAQEEEARTQAVLRWLGQNPGWLLVLDNVDDEEAATAVAGLMANLHGGHALLTGRMARWGAEVEAVELEVLSEEAAVAFLLARTAGKRRSASEDQSYATEIARELGCLPLALEQAGAYISELRLTFAAYLDEWRSRRDSVLTWFDPRVMHYPSSVAVTWQTSVTRLSLPARRLLDRLAWLGPEPIPEKLLEIVVPNLAEPEPDPRRALADLAAYSLATRSAGSPTFTIHRLVQDVTRISQSDDSENRALQEALGWVNAGFKGDPDDVRSWPTLDPLAAHADAVVRFADEAGIAEPTTRLLRQLGMLYFTKALHSQAEPLMLRALAIDEANLGQDHSRIARDLNNLSLLFQATNRLLEAEALARRALAIYEDSCGPDDPNVAIYLNTLALLLQATSRLAEAEPLMRRALAISEGKLGLDHPSVAIRLDNLATLLLDTNRPLAALPLSFRALAIAEKCFGPNHPNVAIRLNNLSQIFQFLKLPVEAEPLIRRALAIDEASFGMDHPIVATRLNNLAQILQDTDRLAEAELLMRRALAIDEKKLGPEHPRVATDLNNLAQLLQVTNRQQDAEPLLRRALTILVDSSRRTGHAHSHLQAAIVNYANLLKNVGHSDAEVEATIQALI